MGYNLRFTPEQHAGHIPFVDTDSLRFIRGGLSIDSAQVAANLAASQGQAVLRNGRLTLLQGSYLSQNPGTGLFEVYCPPVAGVAASVVLGLADAAVQIDADTVGVAGNDIQVVYVNPGGNDQVLHCTYADGIIFVSLATGAAGAITSTANQVIAAINAAAGADVTASPPGTGLDVVTAEVLTPLAGGVDGNLAIAAGLRTGTPEAETGIFWRHAVPGAAGNAVTISYVDPLAAAQPLVAAAPGGNIVISLATNAAGAVISTAAEIVAAALLVGAVTAVAVPVLACSTGNGVVDPMAATNMAGGINAGAPNITGRYACILFDGDVDLQDGDAIANGIDQGRVIAARLPLAPDANVTGAMPQILFR